MGEMAYECVCGDKDNWRIENQVIICVGCGRVYDVQAVMFDVDTFNKQREGLCVSGPPTEKGPGKGGDGDAGGV